MQAFLVEITDSAQTTHNVQQIGRQSDALLGTQGCIACALPPIAHTPSSSAAILLA